MKRLQVTDDSLLGTAAHCTARHGLYFDAGERETAFSMMTFLRQRRLWRGSGARRVAILLALAAWVLPARAQQAESAAPTATRSDVAKFRERAEAALAEGGADKGSWGMLVSDADTGEILYSLNAARYFAPASNAKLFTTAMALATLGPDFRIHTKVVGTGMLKDGRYHGDLVLMGAGDANLSNRVFPFRGKAGGRSGPADKILTELADQVAARGVKVIEGDVVADDSYLDRGRFPSGWTVDDTVWNYGAAVSAVAVNDNTMTLTVRPGKTVGAPLEFSFDPRSNIYRVENLAVTSGAGTEAQLGLSREPESRVFFLRGNLPLGAAPRPLVVGVAEPAENAAVLLTGLLEERGIQVTGHARARHAHDAAATSISKEPTVFAEHVSPTLLEDVRLTNKLSLNLHAELMLRVAAREKGGAVDPDAALKFAAEFRQSAGLQADDALLNDGSGLSRGDLTTPQAIAKWLGWAQKQTWGAEFRATLPVAGEDGTLDTRMEKTAAAGRVQAKTGSFDHVEALSGYATTPHGEHLIFSLLGNNNGLRNHDATMILDSICVAMVEELGAASATGAAPENQPAR